MNSIKRLRYDDTAGSSGSAKLGAAGGVKPLNILIIAVIMMAIAAASLYIAVSGMGTITVLKIFG